MRDINRQNGMTAIGWVLVLALIGFFVLLILRIGPSYLEYFRVSSAMQSLEDEKELVHTSPYEVRKVLEKRFDMNDVYVIRQNNVKVDMGDGSITASAKYESRVHLFYNIDVVMSFSKKVRVVGR